MRLVGSGAPTLVSNGLLDSQVETASDAALPVGVFVAPDVGLQPASTRINASIARRATLPRDIRLCCPCRIVCPSRHLRALTISLDHSARPARHAIGIAQ